MARQFVETVRIENFGCVRDATIALTPLHALIGPNDSGKSSILRAIEAAAGVVGGSHREGSRVKLATRVTFVWNDLARTVDVVRNVLRVGTGASSPELTASSFEDAAPIRGATLLRWDPDEICAATKPLPEAEAFALSERGRGLPAAYEALLSRNRVAFSKIEERVQRLFPNVKSIWLPTTPDHEKALGVELVDGTRVQGSDMSEGLVYWLAFAILEYIQPTPFLLIEEPENGLHPSRIAEVMRVLREVSKTTQIVLATHSPLVINELQPHEVTLLTRDPQLGTIATPIAATTAFKAREAVYALGELWLSFADGMAESALVPAKTGT